MRPFIFLVGVALLTSCSGGGETEEVPDPNVDPQAVATQWLEAVAAVDTDTLEATVEPVGLAVLAGVENVVSSSEMVGLIDAGFTDDLAVEYWTTFRDNFAAIRGGAIEAITVGAARSVEGEGDYTSVDISLDENTGQLILRNVDGAWMVDMAATVGPALVGPFGDYLASAAQGDNAIPIADAYLAGVIPGLEVASTIYPANNELSFEIEYLRQLSTDVMADQP